MEKTCVSCGVSQSIDNFYKANKTGNSRYSRCKKCYNKQRYQWPMKSVSLEYQREQYKIWRNKIVDKLGGQCSSCGYNENFLGLEIDHINNDGWERRGGKRGTSVSLLRKWFNEGCTDLQLLCGTCHLIKTRLWNMQRRKSVE